MLYNENLDIISSSDNKTSISCVVYMVLFSVFLIIRISMAIYFGLFWLLFGLLWLFLSLFKK